MNFLKNNRPTRSFLNQESNTSLLHVSPTIRRLRMNEDYSNTKNYKKEQKNKEELRKKQEKTDRENALVQAKKCANIKITKSTKLGFKIYLNEVFFMSVSHIQFLQDDENYICTQFGVKQTKSDAASYTFTAFAYADVVLLNFLGNSIRSKKVVLEILDYKKEILPEYIDLTQNKSERANLYANVI